MKQFFRENKAIFIILFLALVLRMGYFGIIIKNFGEAGFYITKNGDSIEYYNGARNILEHGIFSIAQSPPFTPEIFRTPGYSAFIAAFFSVEPSVAWVIFWQNIIFLVFAFFVYKFMEKKFNRKAALIAALFLVLEPSIIYRNNQLLSENIFIIAVFAAFVFALAAIDKRSYFAIFSGFCLGAALYLRPIGEYLLVVFMIIYLFALILRKIQWKKFLFISLLILVSFYSTIAPWLMRNKNIFGAYTMTTSATTTFGNYAAAIAKNLNENPVWINDASFSSIEDRDNLEKNLMHYIASHPFVFAKVYVISLTGFFFGDSYLAVFGRIWPSLEDMRLQKTWAWTPRELVGLIFGHNGGEAVAFWLGKIVRLVIVPLFLLGIFYGFKKKEQRFLLSAMFFLIFYFTIAAGVLSYSRFRFAVEPYIFTFVGLAVFNIFKTEKGVPEKPKKILVITQTVDKNDLILGFFHGWLQEMSKHWDSLEVICLRAGKYDLPKNVDVYSLGKEKGMNRLQKILKFYYLIFKLRKKYNAVFIHMNPEYAVLAGWLWRLWHKPAYLWYVHKATPWQLRLAEKYVKKIFTANETSCRLQNRKKIVIIGHGIDTELFKPQEVQKNYAFTILSVGRMSPIKNYEAIMHNFMGVEAIRNKNYFHETNIRFEIIAPIIDKAGEEYKEKLLNQAAKYGLGMALEIVPGVAYEELPLCYNKADLLVHTSGTGSVDKVVLEAMACGTPVLTSSEAFSFLPEEHRFNKNNLDDSNELMRKIEHFINNRGKKYLNLREIVRDNFDLRNLFDKIGQNF